MESWENDAANPFNWSPLRKWRVMGIACFLTFLVGLNSTSITTIFTEISDDFDIDNSRFEYAFFTVSAWNFAAGIFPMALLPLMDSRGTYSIYSVSYVLFLLFIIPQALARNFTTLIVSRLIAGAFGGTIQNAAEGIAANLYKTSKERLPALTIYIFALVSGVTLGSVQGAVSGGLSWRWVFWLQLILYGLGLPLALFGLEETRGHVIERKRGGKHNDEVENEKSASMKSLNSAKSILSEVGLSARLLTTELTVFLFMLWCAFSFGLIFISTESVALVFTTLFRFQEYQAGLVQVSIFIGEAVGLVACLLSNRYYTRSSPFEARTKSKKNSDVEEKQVEKIFDAQISSTATTHPSKPTPERTLHLSIPATILLLSGGLFLYAWSSIPSFPWIPATIGLAMQGCAIQIIVQAVTVYITDSYERCAASAIGAIAFGENMMAAFLPLAALPMYDGLGPRWASSLLGFLALVLAGAPVLLAWKGSGIRARSNAIKEMSWS